MDVVETVSKVAGIFICRRCDCCGIRLRVKNENDKTILKCAECGREYLFHNVDFDPCRARA